MSLVNARILSLCEQRIKKHEGFRSQMYRCPAGKRTIGYGFNLEALDMPRSVADEWLCILVGGIRFRLEHLGLWNPAEYGVFRQSALVEMYYQLGGASFLKFQDFLDAMEFEDYRRAAREMVNSEWCKQTPSRCRYLARLVYFGKEPGPAELKRAPAWLVK